MKINRNFDNLVPNYLFADVAKKTNAYIAAHPDKKVIKLGIGDVTLPLAPVVVEAMKKGAEDLAHKETFKGYPSASLLHSSVVQEFPPALHRLRLPSSA